MHEGASLMVLTEENFARHEYPLSHHGAIYDSYPSNFIKDNSHIKSNKPLVFQGAWSFWWVNEQFDDVFTCKERMIIRYKSPTTRMHKALVVGHLRNRWTIIGLLGGTGHTKDYDWVFSF